MNFTYETQGAITYLVCELAESDVLDSLTLGMLTNNHIAGFAPVIYTEMNGCRFLKYNISAKLTAEQFFGGSANRQRTLTAFKNILTAICSADEYMIDMNCFSVNSEHVFLNVSSCEVAMVCVPTISDRDIKVKTMAFFKQIMSSAQFDPTEDSTYITTIINYVNNAEEYSVYGMKDLVDNLIAGTYVHHQAAYNPVSAPTPTPAPTPAQQPSAPISFDSTISIDDMPAVMEKKRQIQEAQEGIANPVSAPAPKKEAFAPVINSAPVNVPPVTPQATPVSMDGTQGGPQVPLVGGPQVRLNPVNVPPAGGPQVPPVGGPQVRPNPVNVPPAGGPQVPPVGGPQVRPNPVNVPPAGGPQVPPVGGPQVRPNPVNVPPVGGRQIPPMGTPAPQGEAQNEEKKMSFFGLLAHYNKENAATYKRQRAESKEKKKEKDPVQAPQTTGAPVQNPMPHGAPGQSPFPQEPMRGPAPINPVAPMGAPVGAPLQNQFTPVQPAPIQPTPVPVQNSFNETTVLTPAMMGGGETTVLNAAPQAPDPHLIRIKTGEKISINKPVFRIGKEKSYVDFFIGDNTAISRSHANIHTDGGEYFIEDTNSTNHTYVNGKILTGNEKVKIVSGDRIKLANEEFTFSV